MAEPERFGGDVDFEVLEVLRCVVRLRRGRELEDPAHKQFCASKHEEGQLRKGRQDVGHHGKKAKILPANTFEVQ